MKIILVEDEAIAMRKMKRLLLEIRPNAVIVAELESVQEAKEWLVKHDSNTADLVFSDIQLSDGLSFEIFENKDFHLPVVYATAYSKYTSRAFHANGISYLHKPIQKEDLAKTIAHFEAKDDKVIYKLKRSTLL